MKAAVILMVICLSGLSVVQAVSYRIDAALPDGGDCVVLGGVWDGVQTCTINLTILAGDDLLVTNGAAVNSDPWIINSGTITIDDDTTVIGVVSNMSTGSIVVSQLGSLVVFGLGGNSGRIVNHGEMDISVGGLCDPEELGGGYDAGGLILNYGTMHNSGCFWEGGRILNYGTLGNTGQIDDTGGGLTFSICLATMENWSSYKSVVLLDFGPDKDLLSWCGATGADEYAVLVGDLDTLLTTGGNFRTSSAQCGVTGATSTITTGGSSYYLVRPVVEAPAPVLDYGSFESPSVVWTPLRDGEIDAAGLCP